MLADVDAEVVSSDQIVPERHLLREIVCNRAAAEGEAGEFSTG
jgi:hypothetical protein